MKGIHRNDVQISLYTTDFFWQWGQFLDHDIDLTPVVDPAESFDITVPAGDVWFDPANTGIQTISLDRSLYTIIEGVRQQVNEISAFIDASNVYGSDTDRANALRTLDGSGRLRVSEGNLPPFNVKGFPNAPSADLPSLFLAGDFRANEQVGLTSMHTLFIREHNFWADAIRQGDETLSGDTIYQAARAIVAGEMQAITYREFLPVLLGNRGLQEYRGYNPNVNPGIANEFATAAYRFGHTMLSSEILRLDSLGLPIENGNLSLAESFFRPSLLIEDGIDPVLRGLASKIAQEVDTFCVNEIRNFLFGPPGSGGFDLVSLNIQRGRDHGLADFNQTRLDYGLTPVQSVQEIHPDAHVQQRLAEAYPSINDIDLWVGGLAEEHVPGAIVGETFHAIIKDQFERLRAGDRFWYERYLPENLVLLVNRQTLSRIIRRNTDIGNELPNNVFVAN
jgi:peroxidase